MQKKFLIVASLFIIGLITWGVVNLRAKTSTMPNDAVWVQTAKVKETSMPLEVHAIGTLVARSVEITPEVGGHVNKILVHDGAFVKEGTPLIQLDADVAKSRVESVKAQLAYAENDYKRKSLLGKQGAIAQQAIDQARADLTQKSALARENEVMLAKMTLTAPFAGVVGKSKVNPGDYVNVAQSVLTLTDTKHLRIEYNVPERYLPLLKLGQQVNLTSNTYPDKKFIGNVAFIAPTINTETRSVSLYADIPNNDNLLAPGMYVEVSHSLGQQAKVVLVPARSIVPILDGEQIYKVLDGKAYPVTVQTGKRINNDVQITQGLVAGDVIITDGQLKVRNGTPIKVQS